MNSRSRVICVKCGHQIETLDNLVIRLLNYSIHALHRSCYERARSQWIYRLSLNLRGWSFWVYLLAINLVLVLCLPVFPDSWRDLRWFFLLVNIPQLFFRLLALFSYELPLKNPASKGRS